MGCYVGVDLHREFIEVCVMDQGGKWIKGGRISLRDGREVEEFFSALPSGTKVAMEATVGWMYLVDVLEHDAPIDDGSESWDMLTKDGLEIAYGVYLYHVEAPGIGEKVGKFAVIK